MHLSLPEREKVREIIKKIKQNKNAKPWLPPSGNHKKHKKHKN